MTTRADIDRLATANDELIDLMLRELRALRDSLGDDPELVRDALLDTLPHMVARYGDLAAVVSAEWFEDVYGVQAMTTNPVSAAQVEAAVRYAAAHGYSGDFDALFGLLTQGVDKWVRLQGRETIQRSAFRHGYAYARVPRGGKSCAFCLMLASRGAVYESRKSAGGLGKEFHGQCRCQVIAYRDGDDWPSGYDPDELYDMYSRAADLAGGTRTTDVLSAMRQIEPDLVRDSHNH